MSTPRMSTPPQAVASKKLINLDNLLEHLANPHEQVQAVSTACGIESSAVYG